MDKENKGYLEEADFVNGMNELPGGALRMDSGAWKRAFKKCDADGNGQVNY